MLDDELKYKLLKLLQDDPKLSQRAIAQEMGMSLGKVNYCLKALMQKGLVKAKNFYSSRNKSAYRYLLTPKGFDERARVTMRFLQNKIQEYELLKTEIQNIKLEAEKISVNMESPPIEVPMDSKQ